MTARKYTKAEIDRIIKFAGPRLNKWYAAHDKAPFNWALRSEEMRRGDRATVRAVIYGINRIERERKGRRK